MTSLLTIYGRSFQQYKKLYFNLAAVLIISLCFTPYFSISSDLSIRLEDLLFPFVFITLIPYWRECRNSYFILLLTWCCWAVITMAFNGRLGVLNDYFELYKLLKFITFVVFFKVVFQFRPQIFNFVSIVFVLLVLFNLFHYFNLFSFNERVMPIFCPNPLQLEYFGKNSLGGPATKRILGTMGNPNINGILFSFFTIYFLSFFRNQREWLKKILFFMAFGMVLLTQSRTALFATLFVIILFSYIREMNWKEIVKLFFGMVFTVFIVKMADEFSLNYFSDAKWTPEYNGSLKGRLESWKYLWDMILQKPVFGYGINKNYFYENQLYSENEYLLNIWRYGFPGLFFYLFMVLGLLNKLKVNLRQNLRKDENLWYLLVAMIILVNGLTNNVLSNPMLLIIFAVFCGASMASGYNDTKDVKS